MQISLTFHCQDYLHFYIHRLAIIIFVIQYPKITISTSGGYLFLNFWWDRVPICSFYIQQS